MRFCIIGAGSWGTTLADLLCRNQQQVALWSWEPEVALEIMQKRRNPYFVSDLLLHERMFATHDLSEALKAAEVVIFSVPSSYLRNIAKQVRETLHCPEMILNTAKGLELKSGFRLSQVLLEVFGVKENSPQDCIAVLSGPNLASEVALKKLGAAVIGCPNTCIAEKMQASFSCPSFRVYRHFDRTGIELGGALKNVFAIGAGIVDGFELGDNAKAAYLTRALHELVRLGAKLGGNNQTFYGLSGLGDLIATSSSPLSRNYKLGFELSKNQYLEPYLSSSRMVVEGVPTTKIAYEWGKKLNISLPITAEIYNILFEGKSPFEAIKDLMQRSLKDEEG
ncbi:NAD(P)-dependent glycerol-3-phosphate dehydrogenase [bacterium]|nr:NAD(P)-dependent glycerol-3-phosphate dehydrogenase [bacterium]